VYNILLISDFVGWGVGWGVGSGKNEVANVMRITWKFADMQKINEGLKIFFFFSSKCRFSYT